MTTSITSYCACDPLIGSGNTTAIRAIRADAYYSGRSDIVIRTQEGDRVTISSSTETAGGYETYEAFAAGMGTAARWHGASAYYESRQGLNLSVSGDLNGKELNDISKILRTLDKMMGDLVAGDMAGALAGSEKFTGIDSIASFSADMSVAASVAIGRYEAAATSIPLPATRDADSHADGRIDRMANHFLQGLNAKPAFKGDLMSAIEKYFLNPVETSE